MAQASGPPFRQRRSATCTLNAAPWSCVLAMSESIVLAISGAHVVRRNHSSTFPALRRLPTGQSLQVKLTAEWKGA